MYRMEELIPIVGKLTQRYTSLESTSVTYETANQLMGAVLYCLREAEYASDHALVSGGGTDVWEAYETGLFGVKEKVKHALLLYHALMPQFCAYGNRCLSDLFTRGMPEFFRRYDAEFEPQNTILTLDYPVLKDISGYEGIDRVYEFLSCIRLEQIFLMKMPKDAVLRQLFGYDPMYEDLAENICEIVLRDLIVHFCLKKPFAGEHPEQKDALRLQELVRDMDLSGMKELCGNVLRAIAGEYGEEEANLCSYFSKAVCDIAVRLKCAADHGTLADFIIRKDF